MDDKHKMMNDFLDNIIHHTQKIDEDAFLIFLSLPVDCMYNFNGPSLWLMLRKGFQSYLKERKKTMKIMYYFSYEDMMADNNHAPVGVVCQS